MERSDFTSLLSIFYGKFSGLFQPLKKEKPIPTGKYKTKE
jgi:hypothetical protein